jgi:hypothetical protein
VFFFKYSRIQGDCRTHNDRHTGNEHNEQRRTKTHSVVRSARAPFIVFAALQSASCSGIDIDTGLRSIREEFLVSHSSVRNKHLTQ